MAQDKIYPEGIRTFPPNENAPEWVKGTILLTPNDLFAWLKTQNEHMTEYKGKKQIRFQILEGEKGLYLTLDTWKPGNEQAPVEAQEEDDLPF